MSTQAITAALQRLIDQAYHEINRHIASRLGRAGYSDVRASHGKVFEQLAQYRRVKDMADGANVSKQAMGELVAELESAGYVTRTTDPQDRRAKIVSLTPRGRECVAAARDILDELHIDWVSRMGSRSLATASRVLEDIVLLTQDGMES